MFRGDPYILISSIYHQNDSKTHQAQNNGLSMAMSQHNKRTNTVDAGVVLAGAGSVLEDRLIDE